MPFRARFDCLWCGRSWATRSSADVEGWASLCPDCLGRAGENGFLRARLRAALRERAESGRAESARAEPGHAAPGDLVPEYTAPQRHGPATTGSDPAEEDDWYLRRGGHAAGPLLDVPWQAELDQATRWLDGLALSGVIVELAAGAGWWSPLLAQKGELWVTDTDPARLDAARRRLVAHGLLAHIHERDPLAAPDRPVDAVFSAFLLGTYQDDAGLAAQLRAIRAWLAPGGTFAFIEASGPADAGTTAGPRGPLRPRAPSRLRAALKACGFGQVEIGGAGRAFLMGTAAATSSYG